MAEIVQSGQIGLKIRYQFTNDGSPMAIQSATLMELYLKPQGGVKVVRTPIFDTNGMDGKVKWTTELVTDVVATTSAVLYEVQGYVELPGFKGFGSIATFQVSPNL